MAIQKGTGFTNLNKIMQANKGNKLGQTVSGGITGQVEGVKTGVKSAQEQFQEEAQKNRLDTEENKAQRSGILSKFDESKVNVDPNQFKVSSGLSSQYQQQKTAAQKQSQTQLKGIGQQKTFVGSQLDQAKKTYADMQARQKALQTTINAEPRNTGGDAFSGGFSASQGENLSLNRNARIEKERLDSLAGLYSQVSQSQDFANKQAQENLKKIEAQYGQMTEQEKQRWIQSEKDRLMSQNIPTEQDISAFSKFRTGTYTGPQELKDYGSLIGKAQQAEQIGDLTRSAGGRQELLRKFVGGEDYTQGQKSLDELLLSQDPSANLGAASRQTRGTMSGVERANLAASGMAQELKGKAKQFGEQTSAEVQKLRDPLSKKIDEQTGLLKSQEAQRSAQFKQIQDILSGKDSATKGLDKTSQLGLALQQASDSGIIDDKQIEDLFGAKGLVQRSQALGLDTNKLLAERMKDILAQGIDRRAGATLGQEARVSALDKLLGKQGADVEFGSGKEQFSTGQSKFDLGSLQDYLAKSEAEKLKTDPKYAQKLKQMQLSPLQQILAGSGRIGEALSTPGAAISGLGTYGAAGFAAPIGGVTAAAAAPVAAGAMLGTDLLTRGDASAKALEGAALAQSGLANVGSQTRTSIFDKLLKATPGAPGSKQLSELNNLYSKLEQQGIGQMAGTQMTAAQGLRDLTQSGKLDQALAKISGFDTISNIGGGVSKSLFGGKTGNWSASEYGTIDAKTGKWENVGSYADKSSDEILKQMSAKKSLIDPASGGIYHKQDQTKILNELMGYYNQAKAREQSESKMLNDFLKQTGKKVSDENLKENIDESGSEVNKFMDTLKPAAYDYKDEVKDSPLASKNRELGVMAQDLEKSKLGEEAVTDTSAGKVVDYDNLGPKMLASIASLNQRLKNIEKK